jgi:hypothetical protein
MNARWQQRRSQKAKVGHLGTRATAGKPVKSDDAYQIKFRAIAPDTPPIVAKRAVGITLRPASGADDFSRRDPDSIVKQPRKKKAANARRLR